MVFLMPKSSGHHEYILSGVPLNDIIRRNGIAESIKVNSVFNHGKSCSSLWQICC